MCWGTQHLQRACRGHVGYSKPDAMFGENDINFDLQLEKFGVNTGILKELAVQRIFCWWVEDWEEEARKKNDFVSEALLLQKYKGLVFHEPDSGNDFCI
jgi:hypothetical protein